MSSIYYNKIGNGVRIFIFSNYHGIFCCNDNDHYPGNVGILAWTNIF